MAIAAGVAAVAAIGGGIKNEAADSAKDAANAAKTKANKRLDAAYEYDKGNLEPFVQRGNAAGSSINALLGLGGDQASAGKAFDQFRSSTGYQFRLGQGLEAVTQNKAVNGLLKSGSALKGLNTYGQNMASGEFGNYMNALGGQQSTGLNAAGALANRGQGWSAQVSNNIIGAGNTTANAELMQGQAWADTLESLSSIFGAGMGSSYAGMGNAIGGMMGGMGNAIGGKMGSTTLNYGRVG
jgi:hypothetical protein